MAEPTHLPTAALEVALEARARLGEGPVWDGLTGSLRWVDIMGQRVHQFSPRTGEDQSFATPSPVGSVALREDGGLVLALATGFALADSDGGGLQDVIGFSIDASVVRFNEGKADPWGGYCAGTMHWTGQLPCGALYRLAPDLVVTEMVPGVMCSNGLDWSDDLASLYYIDTPTQAVDRFRVDPDTGQLLGRERLLPVEGPGVPDGMTLDDEGCLWVALWGGGEVRRYTPGGRVDRIISLPVSLVTSVAFGGENLDELYITTANEGLSPRARLAEPHAGDLFCCVPGMRGRASSRFHSGHTQ